MKQFKLSFLLFVLLSMISNKASAHDAEIDGIYYNFSGDKATVTYRGDGDDFYSYSDRYSGDIVIPGTVEFNAHTYTVTTIGEEAFYGCTGLTSIEIPSSVKYIGISAFSGCSGLTSIEIPSSVTSIISAFSGCSGLTSITVESGNTVYDSRNNCNAIIATSSNALISGCKNTVIPNSVTSIGYYAFYGCSGLTSIEIPSSVTSIGDQAFYGCSGLTSIEIPSSVTSIGYYAFYGCSGLTSIEIPSSVTSIGSNAFRGCSGLTSITVESGNTTYDSRNNCNAIIETSSNTLISGCKNTVIPNSVTSIGEYAFWDCSNLYSIEIPSSVTSIGNYAFYGCSGLTSVDIPNSVTSIGYSVFSGCNKINTISIGMANVNMGFWFSDSRTSLTTVILTDGVTSIGSEAFKNCSGLTSIEIPGSVTSIGSNAFSGCSGLQKVIVDDIAAWCNISFSGYQSNPLYYAHHMYSDEDTEITNLVIPNGATSIGNSAFGGCSGLTSVEIPNSVTSIGTRAFYGCSGLTSIEIPNSVTSIGSSAFYGCSGLTSVEISNGVTSIGSSAFYSCYDLTSVEIPNSVTSIGDYAFSGCTSLTSIEIPNSVTSIGSSAFEYCNNINTISIGVANIGSWFSGRTSLTTVIMTDGVTSIGPEAFYGCSGLTSVEIPSSVTNIGYSAFRNCSSLTSVEIPSSVTSIVNYAFYGCSGLQKVIVDDIAAWCNISFGSNNSNPLYYAHHIYSDEDTEITNLVIPNGVTSIGDYAFSGCSSLISIEIPNSVTSIGIRAFEICSNLTSIEIPNSVMSIGNYAFSDCFSLASIEIPNNLTSIEKGVFNNCHALTSIIIPNSVTSIGRFAFFNCSGMTSITVESGNTVYDSRNNCNAIIETSSNKLIAGFKSTVIPNSVTSIGDYAFSGCTSLTSIEIPNSVTSIGIRAFEVCNSLTSIEIPSSVTSIANETFMNCVSLSSVGIPTSVTSIGSQAFYGCNSLITVKVDRWTPPTLSNLENIFTNRANANLYVPIGCKAAYSGANCWKDFREIREIVNTEASDVIADGVYYLKNVETGKYLGKGNIWGTHAVLENEGLPARLERIPDGSYTLTFTEGSRFLNKLFRGSEGTYVDYNNQSDCCPYWTITKAETDGTYYIQSRIDHSVFGQTAMPGTYLGNNPERAALDEYSHSLGRYNGVDGNVTNTEGMNITWQLVPAAERCTRMQMSQILALIDLAKTLGLSTTEAETVAANADKEEVTATISSLKSSIKSLISSGVDKELRPLNLTALIVNPSFITDNAEGWEGDTPAFQIFNNAEFFQKTFDVHQTLTGLPNGEYLLKVRGFHRPGSNQAVYTAYREGNMATSAELYANGNSTTLAHHSSGARNTGDFGIDRVGVIYNAETQFVPNSMADAYRWLDAPENHYVNELSFSVNDGTLTFGVRLDESVFDGWVLFDDFQLEFLGVGITIGSSGKATYSSNVDLDFTDVEGLRAYIASGFSPSTGRLTMTRVYTVPAGEGLYLEGEPGSYDIPSVSVDDIYANLLVGVPTATIVSPTDGEYTNLILTKKEGVIAFRELEETGTIASGKAYLHIPTTAYAACSRIYLVFEDEEAMGINSLNDKSEMMNDKVVYDLQGRRVEKPTRGLYIKDGKKFIKK